MIAETGAQTEIEMVGTMTIILRRKSRRLDDSSELLITILSVSGLTLARIVLGHGRAPPNCEVVPNYYFLQAPGQIVSNCHLIHMTSPICDSPFDFSVIEPTGFKSMTRCNFD